MLNRLVLPEALRDLVFKCFHNDLGHQGRDRTASLIKRRFFWPHMNQYIKERVQSCGRCIRRKTTPSKFTHLVNITTTAPMKLVCIDYLSLERSKGGFENILVITDNFRRFAQAIPTRNQSAQTTAKALFENFFVHYGFPAELHSNQGANFESKVIRQLCEIAGIQKTRTTPYHPMGNGMVERFNQTLMNMLGTLSEKQKSDWKAHVPSPTHAYNAAVHESTGFSPFYLMFGRHPRLAIDDFLGFDPSRKGSHIKTMRADQLKDRLADAYKNASDESRLKGKKYKKYYDQGVKHSILEPGDRVLVKKVCIKGKHELADIWESNPYIIQSQPMSDVSVYAVKKEHTNNKPRTLHRNMLLPFKGLPYPEESETENHQQKRPMPLNPPTAKADTYADTSSDSSLDESEDETVQQPAPPKHIIPARRRQQRKPVQVSPPPYQTQNLGPELKKGVEQEESQTG